MTALLAEAPVRKRQRTTSNTNCRGGTPARNARKHYLLVTYESDEGTGTCRCYRCGTLLDFFTITVDRIKPGAEGGTYARPNIRPACWDCNVETGNLLGHARKIAKKVAAQRRQARKESKC